MLVFCSKRGRFSNREIGVRKRLREEKTFKDEFDGLNALIKM
jgi:hypothetical protein